VGFGTALRLGCHRVALVKKHLDAFLQHAGESYAGPLPKYVVDEFRSYLGCGDFSRGFVHVQCTS